MSAGSLAQRGDGYTLVLGLWNTRVANSALYALSYDVTKDFEPVSLFASNPLLIVAKNAVPADDLKGLIAWLKVNPGKASQGHPGVGSPGHIGGVLFQNMTNTRSCLIVAAARRCRIWWPDRST